MLNVERLKTLIYEKAAKSTKTVENTNDEII